MKILHGPQNIGGMAGVLARAQRACGQDAWSYCFATGNFCYTADQIIEAESLTGRTKDILGFFLNKGIKYDGYQFYFGTSYTESGFLDVRLLKRLGKKIFFYFCGCDVRDSKATISNYDLSACSECWPMHCSPNRLQALATAARYADAVFVSTPDLLEFVPNSVLLPQPVELAGLYRLRKEFRAAGADRAAGTRDSIRIAHAPSNQAIKGTKYLLGAVDALRNDGHRVELILIEGMSYEDTLKTCAAADIVVDQLLIGAYGQFAVETMALGKPVICYIREDLKRHYAPGMPVISANPDDIRDVLGDLIGRRENWGEIGARGVDYVDEQHDSIAVAKKALNYYGEAEPCVS